MSKDIKLLRGQVRQVVKEVLPDVLNQESYQALYQRLRDEMTVNLEAIRQDVISTLTSIDNRSKDTQQYIINQVELQLMKSTPKNITPPLEIPTPLSEY